MIIMIFKQIQLFFFAFSFAASTMVSIGMASGRIDRYSFYGSVVDKMAPIIMNNPALLDSAANIYAQFQNPENTPQESTQIQRSNAGLGALRSRQLRSLYIADETSP